MGAQIMPMPFDDDQVEKEDPLSQDAEDTVCKDHLCALVSDVESEHLRPVLIGSPEEDGHDRLANDNLLSVATVGKDEPIVSLVSEDHARLVQHPAGDASGRCSPQHQESTKVDGCQGESVLADERARREHAEAELHTLRQHAEDLERRLAAAEAVASTMVQQPKAVSPNAGTPAPSSADGSSVYELDMDRDLCELKWHEEVDVSIMWSSDALAKSVTGIANVEPACQEDVATATFPRQPFQDVSSPLTSELLSVERGDLVQLSQTASAVSLPNKSPSTSSSECLPLRHVDLRQTPNSLGAPNGAPEAADGRQAATAEADQASSIHGLVALDSPCQENQTVQSSPAQQVEALEPSPGAVGDVSDQSAPVNQLPEQFGGAFTNASQPSQPL